MPARFEVRLNSLLTVQFDLSAIQNEAAPALHILCVLA